MSAKKPITYRSAGVDIDSWQRALAGIARSAGSTCGPEVIAGVGGFGGVFRPEWSRYRDPVLVASTDGVGTKVRVAVMAGVYGTVGRDLVNHCVNDVLCQGAVPLFFLDYVAAGRLRPDRIEAVVAGIAAACRDAGCALLGGETAEMPGVYAGDDFDLAGFLVGIADRGGLIDGSRIAAGDVLLGLPSAGLHTNGYSLARKVFFERLGWSLDRRVEALGRSLGEELLEPHRSYLGPLRPLLERGWVKGLAHITGGGITDNLPRILPEGTRARIRRGSWPVLPIFDLIRREGGVPGEEMYRVFNMGIGMIVAAGREAAGAAAAEIRRAGCLVYSIGEVEPGEGGVAYAGEDPA